MANDTKKFKTGVTLDPQSADPGTPTEGQLQYADGTARSEGLWTYDGASWNLLASGSVGSLTVINKTAAYTLLTTDDVVTASTASGAFSITLPTAVGNSGKVFRIKRTNSHANKLTIDANGSETIDGALTYILYAQYQEVEIVSDGSNWQMTGIPMHLVAYIKDVRATTVAGGTFNSGAWQTRTLNTVSGDSSIVSLATNQFTLGAGKYEIEISAPAYNCAAHKAKLVSDPSGTPVDEIIGSGMESTPGNFVSNRSTIIGEILITSSTTYEIQHRCTTTQATTGFGTATGYSVSEIYTQVKITKLR